MPRILDEYFEEDLLSDRFGNLLHTVQRDPSLDLQIRDNYINIYYRGGNIIKIEKKDTEYSHSFDKNYFQENKTQSRNELLGLSATNNWDLFFSQAKRVMDIYLGPEGKEEREYQQLVVRDNNYSSIANGTDYFIIDIEYSRNRARFDMVAVEWPSEAPRRKFPDRYPPKLVIIEMKYGDQALTGKSGLRNHKKYFTELIADESALNEFKDEMIALLAQKRRLGLIPCISEDRNPNPILYFDNEIMLNFLIANHDPASKLLIKEMELLEDHDVNFIVSNFMGYGIYKDAVYKHDDFRRLYKRQIHLNEI